MDRNKRKELLEAYKELKTYMGTIQITNKANGKIFVESYPNLKNKWMTIQMSLGMGQFPNFELQKDWNELGADAFDYEVLEQKESDKVADVKWELKQMKKKWFEKLQPFEEKGYNRPITR
ncbi:GIY-YIG nuclease family protein [Paenibacillus pinihumi]|uniref:GIY-YIG nuclease family protein n=1 Tax=Paenibacillus pinihumi TaxID=669462 RepID=UPI000402AA92|nr:GIY-YIG nuclease family protein [Paenibacillus pinihumi]